MSRDRDQESEPVGTIEGVIFDVDGVLLASPHEVAWREALEVADRARFATAIYQALVAGRPRLEGARAALTGLGLPSSDPQVAAYAARKQARLETLIAARRFAAFPDALSFLAATLAIGLRLAVASSSRNAAQMLGQLRLADGRTLASEFGASVCGRDLPHGKPDPAIFLIAAAELGVESSRCLVVEDAPAGIRAARAASMTSLGVARLGDAALLDAAHADLVVRSLDEVDRDQLAHGVLRAVPRRQDASP